MNIREMGAVLKRLRGNSLISGASVYLFSNILNAAIPFALLPVLTRYLDPAEYGQVAMFQTLLGAFCAVVGLSAAGAANRKYYDGHLGEDELKSFIAACFQVLMISSFIIFGLIFAFQQKFSEWLSLKAEWILWALAVSALSVIIQIRLGQWQVRSEARKYGVFQIAQSLSNMLFSLLFVVVLLNGAEGRIAAQVCTVTVFSMFALTLLKLDGLLGFFLWRPVFIKEVLSFGVPLIPHVAGGFLLASVDRFFINSELGVAEAGVYMVAVQLSAAMTMVFDAINKAYVPWLFERLKRDVSEEKRLIVRYTYIWFAFILLGAGLAFVLGPSLVTLIAGQQYSQAGKVIGWLALSQAFGGMYLMVTNYIFYSKRTGLLSLATITSGLINVLLLVILIPLLGLTGAAVASCTAMGIRFLLTWSVAQKRHPMPWFNLISSN